MPLKRIAVSALPLFFCCVVAHVPALRADTTIVVTTTADDVADNANCTLREAIIAANSDTAVDACPAGAGADTIVLPTGAYLLSLAGPGEDASRTGDLDIEGVVTIRGAGAAATLIQAKRFPLELSDRVFHVLSGGNLTLQGVTIRGGVCAGGAGLLNQGRLTIEDSRVRDNIADEDALWCGYGGGAGIFNQGELNISRSSLTRNRVVRDGTGDVEYPGGAVLNTGTAEIADSILSANYAGGGGGIRNTGNLQVTDTLISGNGARFWGAGLENDGPASLTRVTLSGNSDGGVVNGWVRPSRLTLLNCTVSGNRSYRVAGSIYNSSSGTVEIASSTVAGNLSSYPGAGIGGVTQRVQLLNTIVANGDQGDCTGPVATLGNNLDSDGSCGLVAPGDLSGVDPALGPLADNGGSTPTHALLPGSPAIDRIPLDQCTLATDQRGVVRPQPSWADCDIGAYEASPTPDIAPMIQNIKRLFWARALAKDQEVVLLQLLKSALMASTTGDAPQACSALQDVSATVAYYVREGSLAAEAAQPLLDEAALAVRIACR